MPAGERFNVRWVPEDGSPSDQVVVEVGLDGFNILSAGGGRALRKYPLHHISRWSMRGSSLILFTRSPVDVEDRTETLQGDEHTIRTVLDTLTSSCMQMAELLQSGQARLPGDVASHTAANSLHALLNKSSKPSLPTADQVEFWRQPEKAGWMHSQGEHIKTWRKRWFVLKQGFLFRFSDASVGPSSKPRGIVDLSQVTDVTDGSAATGRPCSIKLSTATGHRAYICDSETSQVEWISALEGAAARIVRLVAGVDEASPAGSGQAGSRGAGGAGSGAASSWANQLERNFAAAGGGSVGRSSSGRSGGGGWDAAPRAPAVGRATIGDGQAGGGRSSDQMMVTVINYGQPSGGGSSHLAGGARATSGYGGGEYVNVDYGTASIAGASVLQQEPQPRYSQAYPPPAQQGAYGSSGYAAAQPAYAPPQQPAGTAYGSYASAPAAPPAGGGYGALPVQQQQQPTGGYGGAATLMDAATAPPAAPPPPSSPWQAHYTEDGRQYFYNAATGATQWSAPS